VDKGHIMNPIKFEPLDSLIPYARNARTHSAEQVAQIAASMVEWGWTNPVLADAQGVIAGHGRIMAARLLYDQGKTIKMPGGKEIPTGCVPVLDVSGWSDAKRRAYILADNKLALNAGWDQDLLGLELSDLREADFDLNLTGFDGFAIESFLNPPERDDTPPDDFGEVDENIATEHECPKCGYRWSGKSGGPAE
jgi:ParB-like chromosome segregation protein Spo0J